MLTRIALERFTAFEKTEVTPSPGVNVLVGANGTGKTHLMKAAYAACDITKTDQTFTQKLVSTFLPSGRTLGRLVRRGGKNANVVVSRTAQSLEIEFSTHAKETGRAGWMQAPIESVFIPTKDMLANAPGFRSLYTRRDIHFESVYSDIIDQAFLPSLKGPVSPQRKSLLTSLEDAMGGKVSQKGEEFYLTNKQGECEFTLLAEGLRKLGLLWLLIQNGVLSNGTVMFWDSPETNLNPKLFSVVVDTLLKLQRMGVQIFVATHDYAMLKEFDLAVTSEDRIAYHALYQPTPESGVIIETADVPFKLTHSPIADAMLRLYDREVARSFVSR
jgi:energy-coupling factor transporter ATP-binding protein EcfA2